MSDPRPVDPSLFRQLDQALAKLPDDQTPTSQPDPTAPTSASGLCDLLDLLDNYRTESDNTITSDDVNDLQDSLVKARSPMRVAVVDKLSMCLKGEDATTLKALGAFGWATECERVAALLKPKELCHEVGFASTGPDVSKEQLQIRFEKLVKTGRRVVGYWLAVEKIVASPRRAQPLARLLMGLERERELNDAINTLPFGKKYKNSRLNLALYWLMKQHEDVLPDTFFEKTPDYCAKFKLPILGVMQKILDEQAAAAIKITAWLRKYLVRRATTAVVANS